MESSITKILNKLCKMKESGFTSEYFVPSIWDEPEKSHIKSIKKVDILDYFISKLNTVIQYKDQNYSLPENSDESIIYNMMVRYTCSFDHDGDSTIDNEISIGGFRETGTFLKAITLIPYIKSLGVNTIYLLPITSIGKDGKKGSLGSPYAIKDPYQIDYNLYEPFLGMDVETEFKAFVEACHLAGINVILEFVFRTGSIDSDMAMKHPEWFYWIKDQFSGKKSENSGDLIYGPPKFTEDELKEIKKKVKNNELFKLPVPNEVYRGMFTSIPANLVKEGSRITGKLKSGEKCRIPGAFADWPPDDSQPPWDDVTYLRMFDHPEYNYIAYNTVRMYDKELAKKVYRVSELWDHIADIIPHYIYHFDIDGVMIDMGHALPPELRKMIVKKARIIKKGFIFWEENFTLTADSAKEGYDAVVGYLPFDSHNPVKMNEFFEFLENKGAPVPFFATSENHNTPRTASREGGINFSKLSIAMNCLLPGLPFFHSGIELGDDFPVNTGLGFSETDLEKYPSDILPLFSEGMLPWDQSQNLQNSIREALRLREKYLSGVDIFSKDNFRALKSTNEDIVGFIIRTNRADKWLLFAGNWNTVKSKYFSVRIPIKCEYIYLMQNELQRKISGGNLIDRLGPLEYIIGIVDEAG